MSAASEPLELLLVDPSPPRARHAVRTRMPSRAGGDLEVAVGEVVANAREHGSGPVEVVVRGSGMDLLVVVRDRGRGPSTAPPARPPDGEAGRGRGRWLTHRLADVREHRTTAGFEVHLQARG